jgi:hypothetical protein
MDRAKGEWISYAVIIQNAPVMLPSVPDDLPTRIALGSVETRPSREGGRMVLQWRPR